MPKTKSAKMWTTGLSQCREGHGANGSAFASPGTQKARTYLPSKFNLPAVPLFLGCVYGSQMGISQDLPDRFPVLGVDQHLQN